MTTHRPTGQPPTGPRRLLLPAATLLAALLGALLLLTVGPRPVRAADDAPAPTAGHTTPRAAGATAPGSEAAPAGGGHPEGGGRHVEGDERLLQLPPSKDTAISALWVLIIFVVLVAILYPTAWKNVLVGLKKREERIRTDIAEAEAARGRAEKTLAEYNTQLAAAEQQVRDLIQKATVDAQQIADGIRARAQQDAQEAKEKAQADIERARVDAVAQIYEQAATLATAVAERVLPRTLSAEDQQALVDRSLDEIRNMGGPRAA